LYNSQAAYIEKLNPITSIINIHHIYSILIYLFNTIILLTLYSKLLINLVPKTEDKLTLTYLLNLNIICMINISIKLKQVAFIP
jgi:archaellum biogenesis protein FlaJ (TadC family)